MADDWIEDVRSLLDGPSPAVLMAYRKDGSARGLTRHVSRGQIRSPA